jgi:hypothetical protein
MQSTSTYWTSFGIPHAGVVADGLAIVHDPKGYV